MNSKEKDHGQGNCIVANNTIGQCVAGWISVSQRGY